MPEGRAAPRRGREDRRALGDRDLLARREVRRGGRSNGRSLGEVRERVVKPAEERRRDVLDAALRLFVSKGYAETTVSDIASEADMGTGTVYLYFPSKEHVLLGLHQRFREENEAHVAAAAVDAVDRAGRGEAVDYRDTVDAILDAVARYFKENRDLVQVCTKYRPEFVDPDYSPAGEHLGIVARALEAGVSLGMIHTSDPEMTSYLFDGALALNLHMHITYGDPADLDRLIAAAKEMIHKTLALPADPAPQKAGPGGAGGPKGRRSPGGRKHR